MATDNPTIYRNGDFSVTTYYWEGLDNGDDGSPIHVPTYADITFQVVAPDWGVGGSISLEGSLKHTDPSSDTDYDVLHDPFENEITFTGSNGTKAVTENCNWIRPHVTAGNGDTDINCWIMVRRPTDLRT